MKYYFNALEKYDYFIVIKNGTVDSVICRDAENTDYIGRSPESISSDDKLSFDELYEDCLSEMN